MKRVISSLAALAWLATAGVCTLSAAECSNADWMAGKIGAFLHYWPSADRPDAAERFDVAQMKRDIVDMDVDYFFLTFGQNAGTYIAPNPVYDALVGRPACGPRDIIGEMIAALKGTGIRLCVYLPCQGPSCAPEDNAKLGFVPSGKIGVDGRHTPVGVANWCKVISYWSKRYGEGIHAWWFDGAGGKTFTDDLSVRYRDAARTGNPKVACAFAKWIADYDHGFRWLYGMDRREGKALDVPFWRYPGRGQSRHEVWSGSDFTAGESTCSMRIPCDGPKVCGGRQWFSLGYLGHGWGQNDLRLPPSVWGEWAKETLPKGASICIDMGHDFRTGRLVPAQVKAMKAIVAAAKGKDPGEDYRREREVLENLMDVEMSYGRACEHPVVLDVATNASDVIEKTLADFGAVFVNERKEPIVLDRPLKLKPGQVFVADPDAKFVGRDGRLVVELADNVMFEGGSWTNAEFYFRYAKHFIFRHVNIQSKICLFDDAGVSDCYLQAHFGNERELLRQAIGTLAACEADDAERAARLAWWTEARFGLFVHFGLYSLPARHEWMKSLEQMPDAEYDRYYRRFNPDRLDTREWMRLAKKAGMKYAVLTTKHHEGFCLFDSKATDYKSTKTPCGRDIVREFVDAARAEGLKVGFYYSLPDWHHPDFPVDRYHPLRPNHYGPWDRRTETEHPDSVWNELNKNRSMERYREYLYTQVRELLTNYGKIDLFWFDFTMGGPRTKHPEDWQSERLLKMVRELQPGIIVNDRLGVNGEGLYGDFVTPEQEKQTKWVERHGERVFWEMCQTFSGSWGYDRDCHDWKTDRELVDLLVSCVANGGNLILNVGPTGRGEFDYRAKERLAQIGAWMDANGEAIYGCTQAPDGLKAPPGSYLTWNPKAKRLFLLLPEYVGGPTPLDFIDRVAYAKFLHDGSEVVIKDGKLMLPKVCPKQVVPVVELELRNKVD